MLLEYVDIVMFENFEKAFTHTLGLEGKYSNNPNDTGGETMWGITKALTIRYGYHEDTHKHVLIFL